MAETWRDHMPRSVLDPFCAQDHMVTTPTDRRMLWHIEGVLGCAPVGSRLDQLGRDLRQYLNETCVHHWHDYVPDPANENDIAAHRQCLWCNDVEWRDGQPDRTGKKK